MKKLLAAILITFGAATVHAQSGSFLLYGNVDFNFFNHKKNSPDPEIIQKGLIMPGMGIQFNEWCTIGIAGGYNITSVKLDPDTVSKKRTNTGDWRAGGFFRYTHRISDIFLFYAQLDGGYRSGNMTYDGDEQKGSKWTGMYIGLTPAIAINVKKGFCLNFGFGGINYMTQKYEKAVSTMPDPKTASNLNVTFGHQFSIGISKNFGGHGSTHHAASKHSAEESDAPKKVKKVDDDE